MKTVTDLMEILSIKKSSRCAFVIRIENKYRILGEMLPHRSTHQSCLHYSEEAANIIIMKESAYQKIRKSYTVNKKQTEYNSTKKEESFITLNRKNGRYQRIFL